MDTKYILKFLAMIAVGLAISFIPAPEGLAPTVMPMLGIFVATIVGIILAPLPMAVIAILGAVTAVTVGVISWADMYKSNGTNLVWLILMAFFISHGIVESGLGRRVALFFLKLLGKRTLGLGYGLALTELVLAPAMPSVTARAGGVMLPITKAISQVLGSHPDEKTRNKVGSYLFQTAFQCNVVTSAMFITAMAGNPVTVGIAHDLGIELTWLGWATAAFVPGIICLLLIPLVMMYINPPEIKETPNAVQLSSDELKAMGPISRNEIIMICIFIGLMILWIGGEFFGLKAAHAATIGVGVMLILRVTTWKDLLAEKAAWDIMIWIGILIMMAGKLNEMGLVGWFSGEMSALLEGVPMAVTFVAVVAVYFYAHYFFASATAHIGALYAASVTILVASGINPFMAAISLACLSNVFGCLTQYAIGSAPVLFGAGYHHTKEWWKNGFIMSLLYLLIWLTIGPLWWGILGY